MVLSFAPPCVFVCAYTVPFLYVCTHAFLCSGTVCLPNLCLSVSHASLCRFSDRISVCAGASHVAYSTIDCVQGLMEGKGDEGKGEGEGDEEDKE